MPEGNPQQILTAADIEKRAERVLWQHQFAGFDSAEFGNDGLVPENSQEQVASYYDRLAQRRGSPIDPVRIANRMKARVFFAEFGEEPLGGMITRRDGEFAIYVKSTDPLVRQRFTVAHEIGHLDLHMTPDVDNFVDAENNFRAPLDDPSTWSEARRKEWQANAFAAALLMPAGLVRRVWRQLNDVDLLADWFFVSRQAMGFRLAQLDLGGS